jgi:Cysteine-rich CPCC
VRALTFDLAGHRTSDGIRFPCPCCDSLTLSEPPSGSFEICPVCRWEDDGLQFRDMDYRGGANRPSLREARANYRLHGHKDRSRA